MDTYRHDKSHKLPTSISNKLLATISALADSTLCDALCSNALNVHDADYEYYARMRDTAKRQMRAKQASCQVKKVTKIVTNCRHFTAHSTTHTKLNP
jgi:hypothetical protein